MMPDMNIWSGWIQLGFAGACLVITAVLIWVLWTGNRERRDNNKTTIAMVKSVTEVIERNTAVIDKSLAVPAEIKGLAIEIKDQLLESPCMLPEELKDELKPIIRKFFQNRKIQIEKE